MSKPKTLLEDLCKHALSCGGEDIEVEYEDRRLSVLVRKGNTAFGVASFARSSRDAAFRVRIDPAPKLDSSAAPPFTKKQGQYLAFIYNYSKIHGKAPSELDLQRYFQTTPPSIHQMIETLELGGFIERTPGQARSIRLLVRPEHLPVLG